MTSKTSKYDRSEHQPQDVASDVPEPSRDELRAACSGTVAVVIALQMGTTPLKVVFDDPDEEPVVCDEAPRPLQEYEGVKLVVHALRCACESQVGSVFVLVADDAVEQVVLDEVRRMDAQGSEHPNVECVLMDADMLAQAHRDVGGRPFYDVSAPVLPFGCSALADDEDARALLLMGCDQVRIRPRHILALHERMAERPSTEIVTSWSQWQRCLPMLVTRDFVQSGAWRADSSAVRTHVPLAHYEVEEVVFGEEKLAANVVVPPVREQFEGDCAISALEAVRMAHAVRDEEGGGAGDSGAGDSGADGAPGAVMPDDATAADSLLFETAVDVVEELDRMLGADPDLDARVRHADEWGHRVKLAFPVFSDRRHKNTLVYLDSAATSQRLGCALDAQEHFDKGENATVYRGNYSLTKQATASLNDARAVIEGFIGADRRQTILTENTTMGCNLVAQSWGDLNVALGDLIAVGIAEHHSNLMPWMILARNVGARLVYIPLDDDGRIDLEAYDEILSRRPKLVCVAHVSNVLGLENPVREMARRAHAAGARMMVDAAQSASRIPLDVKELGADFVAFSGHKAYGPLGVGCLWVAPDAFDEMDPSICGGGTISHVSKDSYYLRRQAVQYEAGTPPIAQTIGLAAAFEFLGELGMDDVVAHDRALTELLLQGLSSLDDVVVWGDHDGEDGLTGLVSVSIANADPVQVGDFCSRLGVAVRSGGHCALPLTASMGVTGTTRISFGIHTTREDVEAALVALRLCALLYGDREVYGLADNSTGLDEDGKGADASGAMGASRG